MSRQHEKVAHQPGDRVNKAGRGGNFVTPVCVTCDVHQTWVWREDGTMEFSLQRLSWPPLHTRTRWRYPTHPVYQDQTMTRIRQRQHSEVVVWSKNFRTRLRPARTASQARTWSWKFFGPDNDVIVWSWNFRTTQWRRRNVCGRGLVLRHRPGWLFLCGNPSGGNNRKFSNIYGTLTHLFQKRYLLQWWKFLRTKLIHWNWRVLIHDFDQAEKRWGKLTKTYDYIRHISPARIFTHAARLFQGCTIFGLKHNQMYIRRDIGLMSQLYSDRAVVKVCQQTWQHQCKKMVTLRTFPARKESHPPPPN